MLCLIFSYFTVDGLPDLDDETVEWLINYAINSFKIDNSFIKIYAVRLISQLLYSLDGKIQCYQAQLDQVLEFLTRECI